MLDDLGAAAFAEVHVDIGQGDALGVEEAFEKQIVGQGSRLVMRSDQATSEPAAEPRPGPTGMPWSLAQLMNSCTMRK